MVDPRDVGAAAAAVLTSPGHEGKTYAQTGPEAIGPDVLLAVFAALRAGAAEAVGDGMRELTGRAPRTIADFARDHAAAFAPSRAAVG